MKYNYKKIFACNEVARDAVLKILKTCTETLDLESQEIVDLCEDALEHIDNATHYLKKEVGRKNANV